MPIYEYQCEGCGDRSETMQRMTDPPLTTCEQCGGSLKKLISAPSFQFKGSGWYVTDYANKSKTADGGSDSNDNQGSKDAKSGTDGGSKDGSQPKTSKATAEGSSSTSKSASDAKSSKPSSAD